MMRITGFILPELVPRQLHTAFFLLLASLTACSKEPVEWSEIRYSLAGSAGTDSSALKDSFITESAGDSALPIPDSAACRASIRVARMQKSFYAAWWSVRTDSSSSLELSRSDDGGPWTHAVIADSSDASGRGCARPAPSIAADVVSGYVHVAYFIEPASGAGIFSVHTMDRGESFHAPTAMVYGSRPSNTAIAAEGDKVAVAYENPNTSRPQIYVGLSRTMGHIFESQLAVSDENTAAVNPSVKLRGTKLDVSWTELSSADTTLRRSTSRTGTWK